MKKHSKALPDSNLRYRLTDDEEQLLLKYREQKALLDHECVSAGINPADVRHYWYKSKLFSIFAKPKEKSLQDLRNELTKDMTKYSPKYPVIKRKALKDPHCLVIDPADIHIGKLATAYETGDQYNSKLAVQRVKEGVEALMLRASMYSIDQVVLIIGNDILHTDGIRRTTTSGTPQDTDGMWYENFLTAKSLYVSIIEMLMTVADVHVIHDMSNHDTVAGWMLADTISSWFRKSKNVTFDITTRHRKAFVYGNNLIGSTHGDGAKEHDLPLLMAQEFSNEWARTDHRYIYTHHVHHKKSKDYVGVVVESSRSASGTDAWHHKNGYQHATKAIEAYLHHPYDGQVARLTHKFK